MVEARPRGLVGKGQGRLCDCYHLWAAHESASRTVALLGGMCIIAAFLAMAGVSNLFYANSDFERFITLVGWLVLAGLAYLIARTVRRVLAGNS